MLRGDECCGCAFPLQVRPSCRSIVGVESEDVGVPAPTADDEHPVFSMKPSVRPAELARPAKVASASVEGVDARVLVQVEHSRRTQSKPPPRVRHAGFPPQLSRERVESNQTRRSAREEAVFTLRGECVNLLVRGKTPESFEHRATRHGASGLTQGSDQRRGASRSVATARRTAPASRLHSDLAAALRAACAASSRSAEQLRSACTCRGGILHA